MSRVALSPAWAGSARRSVSSCQPWITGCATHSPGNTKTEWLTDMKNRPRIPCVQVTSRISIRARQRQADEAEVGR